MFNRRVGIMGIELAMLGAAGSAAGAAVNHVILRSPSVIIGSRTKQSAVRWTGSNPKRTTPAAQRRAARKRRNIRKHPRCAR